MIFWTCRDGDGVRPPGPSFPLDGNGHDRHARYRRRLERFSFYPLSLMQRVALAIGGILVIVPEIYTDLLGLAMVGSVAAGNFFK